MLDLSRCFKNWVQAIVRMMFIPGMFPEIYCCMVTIGTICKISLTNVLRRVLWGQVSGAKRHPWWFIIIFITNLNGGGVGDLESGKLATSRDIANDLMEPNACSGLRGAPNTEAIPLQNVQCSFVYYNPKFLFLLSFIHYTI